MAWSNVVAIVSAALAAYKVLPWKPARKALKGSAKRALKYVRKAAKDGAVWIGYSDIARALKVDRKNLGKTLRNAEEWPEAIRGLGAGWWGARSEGREAAGGLRDAPSPTNNAGL